MKSYQRNKFIPFETLSFKLIKPYDLKITFKSTLHTKLSDYSPKNSIYPNEQAVSFDPI